MYFLINVWPFKTGSLQLMTLSSLWLHFVYCERFCGREHLEDSKEEAGTRGQSFQSEIATWPKTGSDRGDPNPHGDLDILR